MTEPDDRVPFPNGERSEFDRALNELALNARKVLDSQGRLRSLLRATRAVVEHLDLPTVLRRIVEAAVELVGARYGALGVIAADGHLEQFIHVGISDELAAQMGHLPRGLGILGALVDDPRPIRLKRLSADPRSAGFPPHHPPMESFVGVPVRVRDEVFGNLYLSEAAAGEFTEEDEELLGALAATAGIAIDNARLFEEAKSRQRWSSALADITTALLSEFEGDALDLIAERVVGLADADLVSVLRPVGSELIIVDVAKGKLAGEVEGLVFRSPGTLTGRAMASGKPILVPESSGVPERPLTMGPTMVLPIFTSGEPNGALSVARTVGRPTFTARDLEMASEFAGQVNVALQLAAARSDQQRYVVLEDRSRIAGDLHDHVIQRLFAAGLGLQALAGRVTDAVARAKITEQVEALDEAIIAIRTAIFALTTPPPRKTPALRHRVIDVVAELSNIFPVSPRLAFAGPVDLAIPDEVAEDLLAVLREGLTNVARHAEAAETLVTLTVRHDEALLEIVDDGVGIGQPQRRSGIASMERRAARWDGSVSIHARPGGGTVLGWTARLPESEDRGARV